MTITQFLTLFSSVKETKKGWDVRCPAHDDKSPSLGIMEGEEARIVLNCFAGCTPQSICAALGLQLADLFQDRPQLPGAVRPAPAWKPLPPIKLAFAYELHALDLRIQADKIFEGTKDMTSRESWTNDDIEIALRAVNRGYAYLEWAHFCEDYADHLKEQQYESQRIASGQS